MRNAAAIKALARRPSDEQDTTPAEQAESAAELVTVQASRGAVRAYAVAKAKLSAREQRAISENQSIYPSPSPDAKPASSHERPDFHLKAPVPNKTPGSIKTPAFAFPSKNEPKRTAQRIRRQRKALAIKQLTQSTPRTMKKGAAALSRRTAEAAVKAMKSLITVIAGLTGASVFIVILCAVFLVGALLASPMGILVSEEAYGTSLSSAIAQISNEYSARLRDLRAGYDSYTIVGHAPKWRDVIAVYACKVAGSDSGTDVLTLDEEHIEMMKAVFWDMTEITSAASTMFHEDTNPEDDIDDSRTETVLTITVTARTAEEMQLAYGFSAYQIDTMNALMLELDEWDLFALDLDISDATALAVWESLPDDLSPERRIVVQYALSLAGQVTYFWGGKSLVLGTDPRWGVSTLVTSAGSSTSGTYRPYGMDCSGFVDWCFYNASEGSYVIGQGGGVISQHNRCYAISWSEAIPGDLVFYPGDSHIGIVVGWDSSGNIQICHCASGNQNGVYVTGRVGFTSIARPYYYSE